MFALGGIAVCDTDWPELRQTWQETLSGAGWPLDREIKWHGIRKGEVPPALADAVFATLAVAPFTAYVALLDLELGPEREPDFFRTPEDVYATGLMFLAERFHHLIDAEDDLGLIVVDSRFREDDQRLRRFFADLTKEGTPYMQLPRIVEGLFLGPSHYSIGLRCADRAAAPRATEQAGHRHAACETRAAESMGLNLVVRSRFVCRAPTSSASSAFWTCNLFPSLADSSPVAYLVKTARKSPARPVRPCCPLSQHPCYQS